MNFALNYSPQAADLLQRGLIALDLFKCPNWPDMVATARAYCPVYVHFGLQTVHHFEETLDVASINGFRESTGTTYVNLHLAPRPDDFPGMALDTTDPHDTAQVVETMLAAVQRAVEVFGADRVIVENVPYHSPAVEPDVIRRIVDETGCGFLLDISHARLSARNTGRDEHEYLAQMPGERLRELHVTGIGRDLQGRLRDHLPMTADDWPFVDWVLDRIRGGEWVPPGIMAFEYGGIGPKFEWRSDPVVMAAQVPRLYALAHAI
jgi:uncharacterized protein (UPF0276 family)